MNQKETKRMLEDALNETDKIDLKIDEIRELYLQEITEQQREFEEMVKEKRKALHDMLDLKCQEFKQILFEEEEFILQKRRESASKTGIYTYMGKQYHYLGNKPLNIDDIPYIDFHIPNKGFICNIQDEKVLLVPIYAAIYRGYELYHKPGDFKGSLCQEVKWEQYYSKLVRPNTHDDHYDGYALLMQKLSDSSTDPLLFNTWTSCYYSFDTEDATLDIAFDLNQMDITVIDDYESFIHAKEAPYYIKIGPKKMISQYYKDENEYEYESLKYIVNTDFFDISKYNFSSYICITGYCGEPSHIHIPSEILGLPVRELKCSFEGCDFIKTVTFEASTDTFEGYFSSCKNLQEVTINGSYIYVQSDAFRDCQALTTVNLTGNHINTEQWTAFHGCQALTTVNLTGGDITVDEYTFYGCQALTTVNMTGEDITVYPDAFHGCQALTTLTLSGKNIDVWNDAFHDCQALTTVNLTGKKINFRPDSVKDIDPEILEKFHIIHADQP